MDIQEGCVATASQIFETEGSGDKIFDGESAVDRIRIFLGRAAATET